MGVATFIENDYGRDGAYDLIYDATWFEALLGLVIISLTLLFLRRWPYRPKQWGFALVHVSIVVILISSAITRYWGYEGVMSIRVRRVSTLRHPTAMARGPDGSMYITLVAAEDDAGGAESGRLVRFRSQCTDKRHTGTLTGTGTDTSVGKTFNSRHAG